MTEAELSEACQKTLDHWAYCALAGVPIMSKPYPRRRDVREMLLSISKLLDQHGYIEVDGEIVSRDEAAEDHGFDLVPHVDFDKDFLNEVRDLMRDGVCMADALFAIANSEEVEELVEGSVEASDYADLTDLADLEVDFPADMGIESIQTEPAPAADPHDEIVDALANNEMYRDFVADMIVASIQPFGVSPYDVQFAVPSL